jgi:Alpha/beta hydrolase domain
MTSSGMRSPAAPMSSVMRCSAALVVLVLIAPVASAADAGASCDALLPSLREVKGRRVGPTACRMLESDLTLDGRALHRVDVGLDGTVDGYLTRTGDYKEYLTNAPDLVFPQTADPGPVYLAVAEYQRDKGAAMTIVYPADRAQWNGKAWVMVHGRGRSFKEGNLKAWDRNLDPARPSADLDKYDLLILAKGYALVKTHRTSSEGLGEIKATLEDGSTVDYAAFNDSHRYVMDFTAVARRVLESRLGRAPRRTYFYGHSAGARLGRGLNYTPGLNVGDGGRPVFDGILADDGAAGGWLPVVMKDGRDVLLTADADKAAFVPQIDVSHQMYNNIWPPRKPDWMSSSYLENKRHNARVLRDKGLTPKHRMYEVRGISHSGNEGVGASRPEIRNLELSLLMERFVDMLDAWVEQGTPPPPSRSDWVELGHADRDGVLEHPALALPEVACPLGVYYPFPNTTSGTTAFAAFTGHGLEPLDAGKVFVDMNRNGVWDYRETPTEAWRRLGLLGKGETLTREKYVACVRAAAESLAREGFFSAATARGYRERAQTDDLAPAEER